jgi:hydrogenase nickel incorporation protein HypA/HybF
MHELAVMNYLLESVEEQAHQAGASKVVAINLVVGERSGIVDDSLQFYFDMLTADTRVAGARLNIRRRAMRFHCAQCQRDYACHDDEFACPICHTIGRVLDDGSTLLIESIEIEP